MPIKEELYLHTDGRTEGQTFEINGLQILTSHCRGLADELS